MSGYGLLQASTLGMRSQSYLLNQIGTNVANVNTGGYKRTEVLFSTLVSKDFQNQSGLDQQSDQGGVKPTTVRRVSDQGLLSPTSRSLDLAINGDGFFMVSPTLTVGNEVYFTRDGAMQINTAAGQTSSVVADDGNTITVSNGYLVDKNGYYVLGFPADENGMFSATGTPEAMRVDPYAFINEAQETTAANLDLNLPAQQEVGDDPQSFALDIYDTEGTLRSINFDFYASATENQWTAIPRADNATSLALTPGAAFSLTTGTTANPQLQIDGLRVQALNAQGFPIQGTFQGLQAGDDFTVAGMTNPANNGTFTIASVADDGSYVTLATGAGVVDETDTDGATLSSTANVATPLTFDANGQLTSASPLTLAATWDDGATSSFTIDISGFTQFSTGFNVYDHGANGNGRANLASVQFDDKGQVIGTFSDGSERAIYKIPAAFFTNPDALDTKNGQVFAETAGSGSYTLGFGDESGRFSFVPSAVELSNVDIAQEFTLMIQAQTAYNMSAQTFKTVDEMTTVARDLKG